MSDLVQRLRSVPREVLVMRFDGVDTQCGEWCHEAADELERLQAEVEALRKDAERYRWLRSHKHEISCWTGEDVLDLEELDAAIDAAAKRP